MSKKEKREEGRKAGRKEGRKRGKRYARIITRIIDRQVRSREDAKAAGIIVILEYDGKIVTPGTGEAAFIRV